MTPSSVTSMVTSVERCSQIVSFCTSKPRPQARLRPWLPGRRSWRSRLNGRPGLVRLAAGNCRRQIEGLASQSRAAARIPVVRGPWPARKSGCHAARASATRRVATAKPVQNQARAWTGRLALPHMTRMLGADPALSAPQSSAAPLCASVTRRQPARPDRASASRSPTPASGR